MSDQQNYYFDKQKKIASSSFNPISHRFHPTKVVSSNPLHWEDTTLCDKVGQYFGTGLWFSPGTQVCSNNKSDRHDIAEILLQVALNTIHEPKSIPQQRCLLKCHIPILLHTRCQTHTNIGIFSNVYCCF